MEPRKINPKPLGELLIERKVITRDNLDEALRTQKERGGLLGQLLVSLGYATEDEIAQALTIQYGFPYLPLSGYEIDEEVIKLIPVQVAKQYGLIAVDRIGNILTIAMSNPLNTQAVEDIQEITHCKIQAFVSTLTDVNRAIERYYSSPKA